MKNYLYTTFIILILLARPIDLRAGNGETIFSFLKIGSSARAAAMGDAFVALADDASAISYNPAGLALLSKPELSLMHMEYLELTTYEAVNFFYPMGRTYGSLGFQIIYFNYGKISYAMEDSSGLYDPLASTGKFSSYDMALSLSYAHYLISRSLYVGVNAKYIKEKIDESNIAKTCADIGLLYKTPFPWLTCGINVQNMGQNKDEETPPSNIKTGFLLRLNTFKPDDLRIAFDVNKPIAGSEATTYNTGIEYMLFDYLSLRTGYVAGYELSSYSMGLSLELFKTPSYRITIDYGYAPYKYFGDTHKVSLRTRFGSDK